MIAKHLQILSKLEWQKCNDRLFCFLLILLHARGCSQEDIELLEVPAFAIGEEKRAPWSNARENGELIK